MNLRLMIQILRRKKISWLFNFMTNVVCEICQFLIARCFHGIFHGFMAFELGYCNISVVLYVVSLISFSCIMFSLGFCYVSICLKK